MSLINDALKKVQAQRQESGAPAEPAASRAPAPFPGSPSMPKAHGAGMAGASSKREIWPIILAFVGVALLFAAGAGLIVWGLMRPLQTVDEVAVSPANSAASAEAIVDNPEAASAGIGEQEAPVIAESSSEPTESEPPIEFKLPPSAPPSAPPAVDPPESRLPPATPAAAAPVSPLPVAASAPESVPEPLSAPVQPAPAAEASPPVANPSVESFLARLEVRGIMSGGQKALLFDQNLRRSQAFVPGSTVSNELQLKILAINERSISFVDHEGFVYTKQF